MEKVALFLFALSAIVYTHAQNFNENKDLRFYIKDGLFVNTDGEPYSGTVPNVNDYGTKLSEHVYHKGLKHGKAKYYHSNGVLKQLGSYAYGRKVGKWEEWNDEGVLICTSKYFDGKKEGTWYVFDDKGNKRLQMRYDNDQKCGKWIWWDKEGKVIRKEIY